MKKVWRALLGAAIIASVSANTVFAANSNPTCVLMKFTDDTRYDQIESAASLSDLVMEKLINSGKFNLKETRPIEQNMEAMLYDEKVRELYGVKQAMAYGDYNAMFEGVGFNETKAQSIATAAIGQYITPQIISSIGSVHGAEYLIQGTIVNLGTGDWWDDKTVNIAQGLQTAAGLLGATSNFSPLGMLGSFSMQRTGIGVQSDMRIIKASTGEVIWCKRVTGIGDQKQIGIGFIKVGSTKLNANLYAKAMDDAAQKIVDTLVADSIAQKLFVK